jgi:hypothetical protein
MIWVISSVGRILSTQLKGRGSIPSSRQNSPDTYKKQVSSFSFFINYYNEYSGQEWPMMTY